MNLSLGKALKKKITDKVGSVLAAPVVSHYESKKRGADRRYDVIMKHRSMRQSGVSDPKTEAAYQSVKDYYDKK